MKNLKKIVMVALVMCIVVGASAQQKGGTALLGKLGYQSEFERFGIEMQGRYGVTDQVKLAPSLGFMFPKNDLMGLEVDANVLYSFPIENTSLEIYPLTGLNMSNSRYSKGEITWKGTKWGWNIGVGADYNLNRDDFLNVEFKYTFGGDFARIMFGYGYRF